ncbi:hypothetical protein RO3G_02271 [Rhizopus delemar RA 99-880]|uniref:Uncharacterized protein n=1 Tax=Rhizopus delemar (strain RA 99-880 / ATCC MYA-4621 / FGSC 9543 / NRRL 43880) TaxID=246409 RepID=I1BMY7_RHIO9|nr:hypothetical protein RO3G_02271 [Rhizopus delemar RA 99-880]|eukprot:EIE77567.1 hypothetical protein RO3G_02271 [Rhizopus delemar RA 99-880]
MDTNFNVHKSSPKSTRNKSEASVFLDLIDSNLIQDRSLFKGLLTMSFPYELDGCSKKIIDCKLVMIIKLQLGALGFDKYFLKDNSHLKWIYSKKQLKKHDAPNIMKTFQENESIVTYLMELDDIDASVEEKLVAETTDNVQKKEKEELRSNWSIFTNSYNSYGRRRYP